MSATLDNGQKISGKNILDIRRKMNRMVKIEGPQAIEAVTDAGTVIHVEVWDGQDYVRTASGRKIG